MNGLKVILMTFIFYAPFAYALDCPSKLKVEDVALDMIRAELSGIQMVREGDNSCLSQRKFPHLLISPDASNEMVKPAVGYVDNMTKVKILKVEALDLSVYTYKATFEVSYSRAKNGKPSKLTDSINFFLYKDAPNQMIYGCGGVLQHPENILLFKNCK